MTLNSMLGHEASVKEIQTKIEAASEEMARLTAEIEFTISSEIRHLRNLKGDEYTRAIVKQAIEMPF